MISFTAHPIRLRDGSLTIPDSTWDMTQHPLFIASRAVLMTHFKGRLAGRSVVDLGCLEGGFAVEFARLGMRATGIEVRSSNFSACEMVREAVGLPDLRFVQDDCWNVANYGHFDVVFCSGLLYHLAEPRRYLNQLAQTGDVLILDSHYATETPTTTYPLGAIDYHEGLRGRWYTEYGEGADTRNDETRWASWGNAKSFWPMKDDLIRVVTEAGFSAVFADGCFHQPQEQRTMIAAFTRKNALTKLLRWGRPHSASHR